MFERRLKVFLGVLLLLTAVLVLRAAQVQVVEHDQWSEQAAKALRQPKLVETSRGEIRDRWGRKIAVDKPCVDVTVDYRALTPEPDKDWVDDVAKRRLVDRFGDDFTKLPRGRRKALLADEARKVRSDIEQMWPRLAKITGRPLEEIDEERRSIVEKIKLRRRSVWYWKYDRAVEAHENAATRPTPAWKRWLAEDDAPNIDAFRLTVAEETEQHVILHDVDPDLRPELGKYSDSFPGFALRFGTHRVYPYQDVACHVLGRLTKVQNEERKIANKEWDALRDYEPTDLIGRGGIEGLC